jgi:hypothetical protein
MAQLVKLYDCISRYETNPFHYPTQYIQLKQARFKSLNNQWEKENAQESLHPFLQENQNQLKRPWNPFIKRQNMGVRVVERSLPETKTQLIQHFLDELYPFQITWATSSLSHYSSATRLEKGRDTLKYLLQRFPDIYLIMYHPIFAIKNASIEGDIIMISPLGIDIIYLLDHPAGAKIIVTDERTWMMEQSTSKQMIMSPILSLKRMERIVKSILQKNQIDFPIEKTIVSRTNQFIIHTAPYQTKLIDQTVYPSWFEGKRSLTSSLKSIQLKAMAAILEHSQTTAYPRREWEDSNNNSTVIGDD